MLGVAAHGCRADVLARGAPATARDESILGRMSGAVSPPRVSVLLPCYNAEAYLARCLDSLEVQLGVHFEIVAIDDGSGDRTWAILQDRAGRDSRMRAFRAETNVGLIRTLNAAIPRCRGEYIARMDADDVAMPDRLQTQVAYLDAHPEVDLVSCSLTFIDHADRVVGQQPAWTTTPAGCRYVSAFATPISHPGVMGRRSCFEDFGYSSAPAALHTEDYELWCRLIRAGKRLANIRRPLLRYRISSGRVSARFEEVQVRNFVTCAQTQVEREVGATVTRETVEVLTNRISFARGQAPLREGLALLQDLTARALSRAKAAEERAEIAAAAAMQRLDILTQCALKAAPSLRRRAVARWPAALVRAASTSQSRAYVLEKVRRGRSGGAGLWGYLASPPPEDARR
jgi:hypothetical protein